MKNLLHYSEKKFRALSPEAREKALTNLMMELELQAGQKDPDPPLLEMIGAVSTWMDLPQFADIHSRPMSRRDIYLLAATWLAAHKAAVRDDAIAVRTQDGSPQADPDSLARARGMIVILEDLRSAFNVGSIFRTAECLGIAELWLCGITARPGETALEKTAMGTTSKLKWQSFDHAGQAIAAAKALGLKTYCLETAEQAVSAFETDFSFPCALVLGNEALGISAEILSAADAVIALPVQGWKNSLNVGVAFAVCAYQMIFSGGK